MGVNFYFYFSNVDESFFIGEFCDRFFFFLSLQNGEISSQKILDPW
jgi:hypothetical protein